MVISQSLLLWSMEGNIYIISISFIWSKFRLLWVDISLSALGEMLYLSESEAGMWVLSVELGPGERKQWRRGDTIVALHLLSNDRDNMENYIAT